tara:strand:+ start:39 stop:398 length:360 start_codon:yes stop_codon:yes gene_type:complete
MSSAPSMNRQYSTEKWRNPDDPFDGLETNPTRMQTIDQLEEENKNIQELLVVAASDRQACLRRVAALETHLKSLRASGRLDGGGRKSRRKRRRRNTKKRKTNRKKRKTNRKKRKTKRRR